MGRAVGEGDGVRPSPAGLAASGVAVKSEHAARTDAAIRSPIAAWNGMCSDKGGLARIGAPPCLERAATTRHCPLIRRVVSLCPVQLDLDQLEVDQLVWLVHVECA